MSYTDEQVIDTDGQILIKTTNRYGETMYINSKGKLHRIGGPTVIESDGTEVYYVDGKRHRTEGPAVIDPDSYQLYWVDDIQYTEEQYPKAVLEYQLRQLF